MKIVIAGGTGFVGSALSQFLIQGSHSLSILTRRPKQPRLVTSSPSLSYVSWDAKSLGPWIQILEDADALINLAGEGIADKRWSRKRKDEILLSRIQTTQILVEAMRRMRKPPQTLINASAVGYYGNVETGELTESSPKGKGFLADTCSLWEKAAEEARDLGIRTVRLRIGIVLEKEGGALKKMLLPFRCFAGGPLGSGRQWVPWIHRDEVVRIIDFILQEQKISEAINCVSPNPVTMKQFCDTLGRVLKRPSWAPVPAPALRLLLGEMAELLLGGQCALPAELIKAGYAFRYPTLEKALDQILNR